MSRVSGKNTKPEMTVRRLVYSMGYRYRLHFPGLPGKPDLAFIGRHKVIFVHGCFWHRHEGCRLARLPKSRLEFWIPKLDSNRRRDERNYSELLKTGWDVLTIWECETNNVTTLRDKIIDFLSS
jgi:DNA mismatch endonuclease, patch repair protein